MAYKGGKLIGTQVLLRYGPYHSTMSNGEVELAEGLSLVLFGYLILYFIIWKMIKETTIRKFIGGLENRYLMGYTP